MRKNMHLEVFFSLQSSGSCSIHWKSCPWPAETSQRIPNCLLSPQIQEKSYQRCHRWLDVVWSRSKQDIKKGEFESALSQDPEYTIFLCVGHDYDVSGIFMTEPRAAPGPGILLHCIIIKHRSMDLYKVMPLTYRVPFPQNLAKSGITRLIPCFRWPDKELHRKCFH